MSRYHSSLEDYYSALSRLTDDAPRVVAKGTKISNDSVALEAGRGKGSIKKSRPVFRSLIAAIDEARRKQVKPNIAAPTPAPARFDYQAAFDAAIAREVSLLHQIYELKKRLSLLTGANVLPIRGHNFSDFKNGQE